MLKQRVAVALPLTALFLLSFLLPGWAGAGLFCVLSLVFVSVAVSEFFTLTGAMGVPGFRTLTIGCAWLLVAASAGSSRLTVDASVLTVCEAGVVLLFVVAAVLVALRRFEGAGVVLECLVSIAGFIAVVWMLDFIAKLYFAAGLSAGGRVLTLFMILVTKLADVGAYAVGTFTAKRPGGNHRLAPTVSPKKSWEGLAGGIVASVVTAAVFVLLWGRYLDIGTGPILGVGSACCVGFALAILGLVGDLAESLMKRAAGAKDSGRVPGLGGVLDMVDSLIFVAPAFYLFVAFMVAKG